MSDRILQVGFVLMPFYWFSIRYGDILPREGQFLALQMVIFLAIAFFAGNNIHPSEGIEGDIWVRMFSVYIVAWVIFANLYAFHVKEWLYVIAAIKIKVIFSYILTGVILYVLVARSSGSTESFYNAICIGALVQCAIGVPQLFGWWIETDFMNWLGFPTSLGQGGGKPSGLLENQNFFSGYLAISLPFFFRFREHWWQPGWHWGIPVVLAHVFFSTTATSMVAVFFCMLFYFRLWRHPAIVFLGSAAGIAYIYFWKGGHVSLVERLKFIGEAWSNHQKDFFHLMFGHGPGASWGEGYPMHNEWVQTFYELGITWVVMVVGYILTLYRKNRILMASVVTIAVIMLGSYPLHLPVTGALIAMVLGLIAKERLCQKNWQSMNPLRMG